MQSPRAPLLPLLPLLLLLLEFAASVSCSLAAEAAGAALVQELRQRQRLSDYERLRSENRLLKSEVGHLSAALSAVSAAETLATEEVAAAAADEKLARRLAMRPMAKRRQDASEDAELALLARRLRSGADESRGRCFAPGGPLQTCDRLRAAFGFVLDAQADRLCGDHQLCVACSAAYGVPQAACDTAFITGAAAACTEEADVAECGRQADELLGAMRMAHLPADSVAAAVVGCGSPCVADAFRAVWGDGR